MEGAQTQKIRASLAQAHMPSDDVYDVGSGNDFLDEGLWDLTARAHGRESSGGVSSRPTVGPPPTGG